MVDIFLSQLSETHVLIFRVDTSKDCVQLINIVYRSSYSSVSRLHDFCVGRQCTEKTDDLFLSTDARSVYCGYGKESDKRL